MKKPWDDSISKLAFANALGHWRYSLSTITVLGIGLLSIWMFRGYMSRVGDMYRDNFSSRSMLGQIIIEPQGAENFNEIGGLHPSDQTALKPFLEEHKTDIDQTVRFLVIDGQISISPHATVFQGLAYDIVPGEVTRGPKWAWNAVAGTPLKKPGEVILGRSLGRLLDCQFADGEYLQRLGDGPAYKVAERPFSCSQPDAQITMVTSKGQVHATDMHITGLMDAGLRDVDRTWVMMDLSDGQRLLGTEDISWISLKTRGNTDRILHDLQGFIRAQGLRLEATRWDQHRRTDLYRRTMDLLRVFEIFVLSILVGIVGISVFNLMAKIVSERRREIGLLRSIGYNSPKILRLFLSEAAFTSLLGLVAGSIASLIFAAVANRLGIVYKAGILSESVPFAIGTPVLEWLSTLILLLVISVTASFLAIRKALKKTVIECLI